MISSESGSTIQISTTQAQGNRQVFQKGNDQLLPKNLGKIASRASRATTLASADSEHKEVQLKKQIGGYLGDDIISEPQINKSNSRQITPVRNKGKSPIPKKSPTSNSKIKNIINSSFKTEEQEISSEYPLKQRNGQVIPIQDLKKNKSSRFKPNGRHQATQAQNPFVRLEEELVEDLSLSQTSFQFVINSLSIAFEMKPKQTIALLADNQQYLMHICVKGMKGGQFNKVMGWYDLIIQHVQHLSGLMNSELSVSIISEQGSNQQKTLFKTLNIFKGGFYSKNKDVVNLCINFFTQLIIEINLISGEIVGETWEWFIRPTALPIEIVRANINSATPQKLLFTKKKSVPNLAEQKSNNFQQRKQSNIINSKLTKSQDEETKKLLNHDESNMEGQSKLKNAFFDMLMQTGLQGIIYSLERNSMLLENICILLMNFGKHNPMELFTDLLQSHFNTWDQYASLCQWLFLSQLDTELGIETIQDSGVLSYWILQSLRVSEGQIEITLDDRIQSLVFLTEIWLKVPDFISNTLVSSGPAILSILKRASRDVKFTLSTVSIELMFRLLENFATSRNPSAPIVYKTLTFLLAEFYWEVEIREMMLKHFGQIFKQLETIPIEILCKPLLKQVSISQYHFSSFNVFDFEFFQIVAYHKKLTLPTALALTDTLTKIALSSVFYAQVSINVLKTLIMRFSKSPEQLVYWQQSFRNIISTLFNMEIRKQQHVKALGRPDKKFYNRLSMKQQPKLQQKQDNELEPIKLTKEEQVSLKMNEKLIVNLLGRIIDFGNDLISEELRKQLLDMFINLQQSLKVESNPIRHLLNKFGFDISLMVEQRKNITVTDPIINSMNIGIMVSNEYNESLPYSKINIDPDLTVVNKTIQKQPSSERINQKILEQDQQRDKREINTEFNQINDDQANRIQLKIKKPMLLQKQIEGITPKNIIKKPRKQNSEIRSSQNRTSVSKVKSVKSLRPYNLETEIELYDYAKIENSVNLLRYKKALNKQKGIYKAIFNKFQSSDQNKRVQASFAMEKKTFDDLNKTNNIISVQGLIKMIQQLGLEQGKQSKILRDEVTNITKLINLKLFKKSRVENLSELDFVGFQEFILQYLHLQFNSKIDTIFLDYQDKDQVIFPFKAYQLQEKFYNQVKQENVRKSLNLPKRYFEADEEEQAILDALTTKLKQEKNFQLPKGYTKVKATEIKDIYEVPEALNLPDSYKISVEILDQVVFKALGIHVIVPTPVIEVFQKVKVDKLQQNPIDALKNYSITNKVTLSPKIFKAHAGAKDSKKYSLLQESNPSINLVNLSSPQSELFKSVKNISKKLETKDDPTDDTYTSIVTSDVNFKSNLVKSQKTLSNTMKLAILEAREEDQAVTLEVAQILNEVITAVEINQHKNNSKSQQPRVMNKYVSRKTLRKLEEEEKQRKLSKDINEAQKKERTKSLKENMARNEQFLKKQIEQKKAEQEERQQKAELEKQERLRKEDLRKQKFDQMKLALQLREQQEKDKKEQEDKKKVEETQQKDEQAKQERKMMLLRRKQFAKEAEQKAKEKKEKEEKEKAEKEDRDKALKKEQVEKYHEVLKRREEVVEKKKGEKLQRKDSVKKSKSSRTGQIHLNLSKDSGQKPQSNVKLSIDQKSQQKTQSQGKMGRSSLEERQFSTHLAKIDPLIREDSKQKITNQASVLKSQEFENQTPSVLKSYENQRSTMKSQEFDIQPSQSVLKSQQNEKQLSVLNNQKVEGQPSVMKSEHFELVSDEGLIEVKSNDQ